MAFEKAKSVLVAKGYGDRIYTFDSSSATVELAAACLGTEPKRIAKSLTFDVDGRTVMIVCAGDAKVNNGKFKALFSKKPSMLPREVVLERIGHDVGGVCPFGVNPGVEVCLDVSLKRFETVYPAVGDAASAVCLTPDELENASDCHAWVDVCTLPEN